MPVSPQTAYSAPAPPSSHWPSLESVHHSGSTRCERARIAWTCLCVCARRKQGGSQHVCACGGAARSVACKTARTWTGIGAPPQGSRGCFGRYDGPYARHQHHHWQALHGWSLFMGVEPSRARVRLPLGVRSRRQKIGACIFVHNWSQDTFMLRAFRTGRNRSRERGEGGQRGRQQPAGSSTLLWSRQLGADLSPKKRERARRSRR